MCMCYNRSCYDYTYQDKNSAVLIDIYMKRGLDFFVKTMDNHQTGIVCRCSDVQQDGDRPDVILITALAMK